MTAAFSNQVDTFAKKYETRLRAVARGAVLDTVELAQMPGPTAGNPSGGQGGRMPIVTGFLRASIQGAVGSMPSGPTTNEGDKKYTGDSPVAGVPVSVALLTWDPNKGEPFFVGWTAIYARRMEYKYGFMRGAVELWDQTVEGNVLHVEQRLG